MTSPFSNFNFKLPPPISGGTANPFATPNGPGGGGQFNPNGPGGIMGPTPGQGNPNGNQYQQMRYRRLAGGQGGQPTQSPYGPNVGNIYGPGGTMTPQPSVAPGHVGGQITGSAVTNPGLLQPSQATPFTGMGGGQVGQQQGYPASQATNNPYMQQFRQPQQQPQQMPANPYNPYQNDWNWNQSGQFPGNRFPAY